MKLHPIRTAVLSAAMLVLAAAPRNAKAQNWAAQQPPKFHRLADYGEEADGREA